MGVKRIQIRLGYTEEEGGGGLLRSRNHLFDPKEKSARVYRVQNAYVYAEIHRSSI